jgi:hypothetical protein
MPRRQLKQQQVGCGIALRCDSTAGMLHRLKAFLAPSYN